MAKKVETEKAEVKTAAAEPKKKTTAKKTAKKELTAEESVVILACLNANFLEKLNKLAEKEGVKLVLTNEQVIHDYIAQQSGEIDESARMTAFLKDDRNRKVAFAHAKEIFSILARTKDLTKAADLEFEKKMLVKATTLSWKKADEMLNTLEAFGYAKRTDNNRFKIIFDLKDIRNNIRQEVTLSVESLNFDIERYKGAVEESSDIENKAEYLDEFKKEVTKNIVF